MSIEKTIADLTVSIVNLTSLIQRLADAQATPMAPKPVMVTEPVTSGAPAPTVSPAPAINPLPVAAPTFMTPPPVVQATPTAPFNDAKGLLAYVMDAYKAMGPEKGAQIQTVLTHLKYNNINDVQPEHYTALYLGIEQLKAS